MRGGTSQLQIIDLLHPYKDFMFFIMVLLLDIVQERVVIIMQYIPKKMEPEFLIPGEQDLLLHLLVNGLVILEVGLYS